MNSKDKPYIISVPKIGESKLGYISVIEESDLLPFSIKRVFWAYFTPEDVMRGYHAHHDTEMILIAVAGKIIVRTEMPDGTKNKFTLNKPTEGVFLPRLCWHTMQYSHNAVQMVLASQVYQESDYIRDYKTFKNAGVKKVF